MSSEIIYEYTESANFTLINRSSFGFNYKNSLHQHFPHLGIKNFIRELKQHSIKS